MPYRKWVYAALRTKDPELALGDKAIGMLTTAGLSRESVMSDLAEALETARRAPNQERSRVIADVIDRLIGWSSLEASLENVGESEYAEPSHVDYDPKHGGAA